MNPDKCFAKIEYLNAISYWIRYYEILKCNFGFIISNPKNTRTLNLTQIR